MHFAALHSAPGWGGWGRAGASVGVCYGGDSSGGLACMPVSLVGAPSRKHAPALHSTCSSALANTPCARTHTPWDGGGHSGVVGKPWVSGHTPHTQARARRHTGTHPPHTRTHTRTHASTRTRARIPPPTRTHSSPPHTHATPTHYPPPTRTHSPRHARTHPPPPTHARTHARTALRRPLPPPPRTPPTRPVPARPPPPPLCDSLERERGWARAPAWS